MKALQRLEQRDGVKFKQAISDVDTIVGIDADQVGIEGNLLPLDDLGNV